jgi:hypothetical protein
VAPSVPTLGPYALGFISRTCRGEFESLAVLRRLGKWDLAENKRLALSKIDGAITFGRP